MQFKPGIVANLFVSAIFLAFTAATVYSSVEHHSHIAEVYGRIANLFVPLISLGSLLLGAFVSLSFQWGISAVKFEMVLKLLPHNEAAVMKILFSRRKITQAELSSETGLSRPAVSRVLTVFEGRGLVDKKPEGNTNRVVSKLYGTHPGAQTLSRMPGFSEGKVAAVVAIIFMFGIALSLLNNFHVQVIEHPLEMSLYLLAVEFFVIGSVGVFLARKRVSDLQLGRTLSILPRDERELLGLIHLRSPITQKALVDEAGVYKMKVSRAVQKFEAAGVVGKKPHGYTNMLYSKL
jgi:uncharacterized membrane protein